MPGSIPFDKILAATAGSCRECKASPGLRALKFVRVCARACVRACVRARKHVCVGGCACALKFVSDLFLVLLRECCGPGSNAVFALCFRLA